MLYPMSINKEIHSSGFVMTANKVGVELHKKASHHKHVWKHAAGLEECLTPHRLSAIAAAMLNKPLLLSGFFSKEKKSKTLLTTNILGK